MKPRAFPWLLGACFSLSWAASCSSSDGKHQTQSAGGEGGEDAGGSAGSAGQSTMNGGMGASTSAMGGVGGETAGAATTAGAAGDANAGGASGAAQGGAAMGGVGGIDEGGAGGQGGANACCSPSVDYDAAGSILPTEVTCSTWQLVNTADVELPLFSAGALRVATSANSEVMYYTQPEANLVVPAVLTIEARMKLVSGSTAAPGRAPAVLGFVYGATHQKNLLQMAANEVFLLDSENVKGPSVVFDTTSAFHTYKLVVDTQLGSVQVFIDEQLKLAGNVFVDPGAAPAYITFGQGSTYSNGTSDWLFVKHNANACVE